MIKSIKTSFNFLSGKIIDRSSVKGSFDCLGDRHENSHRFELLSQFFPTGIFVSDANGKCTYVNDSWLEMSGLTRAQALDFGWIDAIYLEDRSSVLREWNSAAELEQLFELEFRFQKPSKAITWIHAKGRPYRDQSGKVTGYVSSCFDISEQKSLEQHFDRTIRQFGQAETIAKIGSWRLEISSQKFEWSDQTFEIHGIHRTEGHQP